MRRFLSHFLVFVCLGSIGGIAQNASESADELARVSRELQQTRSELAESRKQIEELRQGLQELRDQVHANQPPDNENSHPAEPTAAAADKDAGFLAAKVAELHQDKVESAGKYPVKLSGLVLFNSYGNAGTFICRTSPSRNHRTSQVAALARPCAKRC